MLKWKNVVINDNVRFSLVRVLYIDTRKGTFYVIYINVIDVNADGWVALCCYCGNIEIFGEGAGLKF